MTSVTTLQAILSAHLHHASAYAMPALPLIIGFTVLIERAALAWRRRALPAPRLAPSSPARR